MLRVTAYKLPEKHEDTIKTITLIYGLFEIADGDRLTSDAKEDCLNLLKLISLTHFYIRHYGRLHKFFLHLTLEDCLNFFNIWHYG